MPSKVLQGSFAGFVLRAGGLVALILAFGLPVGSAAAATNYTVTTTADTSASGGACASSSIKTPPSPLSLREATCLANNVGGEVNIAVPAGEYKLSNGELIPGIATGQTVNYAGAGAASTIVNAQSLSRVFDFDSKVVGGVNGKITGLEITGGASTTFGGAGIIAGSGNVDNADELTLESVLVKGNVANASAPTITNRPGGGVQMATGKLTVINSTFTENASNGSRGSAIAVISNSGMSGAQGLKVVGSTFSLNKSGNGYNEYPGGGAIFLTDQSGTNEITESKFIGNEVNSPTAGGAEGAAIFGASTIPTTITRSIFSGNKVSSPSGGTVAYSAIASELPASSITLHYNRFHANNTSSAVGGTGTWNATENWWGCNTGANTAGCEGAAVTGETASITTTPYLKLNGSASPTTLAGPNATSTLQGDFLHDSAGGEISAANLTAFAGEPLTWSDPKPAGATINGHAAPETTTTNITSGKTTATYNSQSTSGAGHAVVAFDNASVTIPLTVDQKPAVTQNPSNQSVSPGATATFTAAASGTPTPTVQWQRNTGSGFANIGGATSTTYSFTTTSASETGYEFRAVFSNTIEGTPYTATTSAATLTVSKAVTSLSTTATSGHAGSPIKDTATLSGGKSPTGTITFKVYGPNDSSCSGTVANTSSKTVTANGSYESAEFTPSAIGTYRWVVEYSGDSNNESATSGCNAANETSTVSKYATSISSSATGSTYPGKIKDTATLSGGGSPTGTITFKAYGPNDGTCSGAVAYTKSQTVTANGSYESEEFTPTTAGAYRWSVEYSGDANNEASTSGCNASNETSAVAKATTALATEAIDGQAGTTAIHDTATLSGGATPTGTITFKAYGPNDATCSNAAAFSDTQTVTGNGAVVSTDFAAGQAGTYRWTAEYSGDANNSTATSGCNASEETSTVAKAEPTISTEAQDGSAGFQPIEDLADLEGGHNPTGTVTFNAYGPNDATCSGTPAYTEEATAAGNGHYSSGQFQAMEAGEYRWTVEYSGDANNEGVSESCNGTDEKSTVEKASTGIGTVAEDGTIGSPIHDTANIFLGAEPGGSITFEAFGPNDATCSGTPAFTDTESVNGNGPVESAPFTPTALGEYRWTAEYSGDANNETATSGCNEPEETSHVTKAEPTISTEASNGVAGGKIHDTATLAGGFGPTGSITFKAYGPNDATCSNAAAFTDTETVSGNGVVESAEFNTDEAGAYRWTAEYSGDANNAVGTSGCNEPEETSTVGQASPALSTEATDGQAGTTAIHDTATLSGGVGATGTITFKAYGPEEATCSGATAFTDTQTVTGNGSYPSANFTAAKAGEYRWTAEYSGDANNETATSGCNASEETSTVTKAAPGISTEATNAVLGSGSIHDTATLASGSAPTGTITFKVYGPNDLTCSGTTAFTDNQTVSGNGTYSSGNFTPTAAGTYRWTAEYSGDANNETATSGCNASKETSTVTVASPSISTQATNAGIGSSIHDTATLSGGQVPTGTITFKAYGPNDATCANVAAFTDSQTVTGNGSYPSANFTPATAGTYRWTAGYSGDLNNASASSGCNASNEETSTVAKATPTISSVASDGTAATTPIEDSATLAGGHSPTGTITFKVYGPEDATCGNPVAYTKSQTVTGNGAYESEEFTPSAAGAYRWTVQYSGDANNEAATSGCNATNETSNAAKASPGLSTAAVDGNAGSPIHDSATISAGASPGGSITFKVYGPDDATCSNAPAFTTSKAVSGNGTLQSADFTPLEVGSYRWTANYSGDTNNEAASSGCNASGETSTVDKGTPGLTTKATDAAFGSAIHDTATLTGGAGPTGTITFKAYGPDDTACSGLPAFSATVKAEGEGFYGSGDFTPTQSGTYRWVASYSGDANNLAVAGLCGTEGESSIVSAPAAPPAPPAISPCPATSPSVAPFEPPKKTVNGPVPGVRARIAVARPSQLSVTATLKYRRNGKTHSVALGTAALYDGGSANLKLALPEKLAKALPVGTRVHLTLSIAAYPAGTQPCSAQPEMSTQQLRTKVVRVLVD